MNEKEVLEQRSKEELIDIILKQREKIRALRKKLNLPAKTPENSSKPSGQSRKPSRSGRARSRSRRGPKEGHEGKSRTNAEPDVTVEIHVESCEECGSDLSEVEQRQVGSNQVVEIPPVQPVVIEAHRYEARCPECGNTQQTAYPEGLEATRKLGPRLEALVHYLHMAHPLSYQRVQSILKDGFGLNLSKGALVNIIRRGQERFKEASDAILETIRGSNVIGSDETGARVDGDNQWLWVVQTPDSAYYTVSPTRGAVTLETIMDGHEPVVWVSDLCPSQLKQPALYRQICLPHQVRELQYAIDAHRCAWAYRFQALLERAQKLGKRYDDLPPRFYRSQVLAIEKACDELLKEDPNNEDSCRLKERFLKHRDHLFTFLHLPNVPSSNNASEQALRNGVIYRKVTGGFRSDWGAQAYAQVLSVLETARRRGEDILQTLFGILSQPFKLKLSFG